MNRHLKKNVFCKDKVTKKNKNVLLLFISQPPYDFLINYFFQSMLAKNKLQNQYFKVEIGG